MSSRQTLSQTAAGALRAEMARQQKTSAELAQHIDDKPKSAGYVSARMNCHKNFTLDEIERAAEWLDVPYISLLTAPKRESEAA